MSPATCRPDLLEAIVGATRAIIEERSRRQPIAQLRARADGRRPRGDQFKAALADRTRVNIIAECKRRSPSRGVLRRDYDPVAIARAYERSGAVALSILTEPTFFDGALDHLSHVREAVRLPLLRKDFILDGYQLLEAVAHGADAVLLIAAALSDVQLTTLHAEAAELGLAAVVEIHDQPELDRALTTGAEIVGVNNRNLRTMEVDTHASETLAEQLPAGVVAVSESGLKSRDDLVRLRELGYSAFLIGERFMTSADPGRALEELLA